MDTLRITRKVNGKEITIVLTEEEKDRVIEAYKRKIQKENKGD